MEPPQLFQAFLLWLGQLLLPGGHKEAFKLLSKPFLMSSHPFTSMSSSLSLPAINPFKIFWAIPNFYSFGVRVWLSVQGLHLGSVSLELSFCYKYTKAETKANKKTLITWLTVLISDWTTRKKRTNCSRMVREIEPWSLTKSDLTTFSP